MSLSDPHLLLAPPTPGSLRRHSWPRFLRGPDQELLEKLYVPALGEAVRYDRCCAYFSSSVLAAAARGFGKLIERLLAMGELAPRPAVRLVVNEELTADDIRALTETGDLTELEGLLLKRFKSPKEILEKQRLAMLGWLVKHGLLDVRVGVLRRGEGIVHAKFGLMTDEAGDAVVFNGSGNESALGLIANYERLEVSPSWDDRERHLEYAREFESLWNDRHPDVHTVSVPEALRLRLVKFAPADPPMREPSNALARQKAAMIWQFIKESVYLPNGAAACDATAMVEMWPHQGNVVEEVARAWPEGRLLCDEVGMGKTVEAILVLRRLLAGRGVRRALLLIPAGLLKQWQAELREKGGLLVPRLEGVTNLVWPDGEERKTASLAEALRQDVLLLSRETARTENNLGQILAAEPWDLVLLDEAHAARRSKQEEREFNASTLLLGLLRELQLRRRARGFLLLSATPMQTHPWEPWDLLSVLGEGGAWLAEFHDVRQFYSAVAAVKNGRCEMNTAQRAAALIASDSVFPPPPGKEAGPRDAAGIARTLVFAKPSQREELAGWLRQGSPLARRMHRNTRKTLRGYYEQGLLPQPPPRREVHDIAYDYRDPAERDVYVAVSQYIEKRFEELEQEKPGKGFVMTIYRRRASSSPLALERSLRRREEGLRRIAEQRAYDILLSDEDVPSDLDRDDLPEDVQPRNSALPQDPQAARLELVEVRKLLELLQSLGLKDTKRDYFFDLLRQVSDDGRPVLVFTEYTDTLEYLQDALVGHYGASLGCYSGSGGQRWDGEAWKPVTKDVITDALHSGQLRVLLCTDAASEGLNLQTAGAVINYDLPWNPSRVEQRIGRVDRIGQMHPTVQVVNLFLRDSVDDQVYTALRSRCGLFEHFVGTMQPVLAHARRMLQGQEPVNLNALRKTQEEIDQDPLVGEIYLESPPHKVEGVPAPLTRSQVESGLAFLREEIGFRVRPKRKSLWEVAGSGLPSIPLSAETRVLEGDTSALPLSPLSEHLQSIAGGLGRPGERLPLVIGSFKKEAFRSSVAYWILEGKCTPVESFQQLQQLVNSWDGTYPKPAEWQQAASAAQTEAENVVQERFRQAADKQSEALARQVSAARLRLLRELGRYLICLEGDTSNLNGILYRQMTRDIASAGRLRTCLERFCDYPQWPPELLAELFDFHQQITPNQKKARLLGSELDAALEDPRWLAT